MGGGLVWSATTGQAPPSQHPTIFGGSLVLDDYRPLTVIDLATGAVTVQLEGVYAQVGASSYSDVEAVATTAGCCLLSCVLVFEIFVIAPRRHGGGTLQELRCVARLARGGMLDALAQDFVRTARAKGLPERRVVWKHALRVGITLAALPAPDPNLASARPATPIVIVLVVSG